MFFRSFTPVLLALLSISTPSLAFPINPNVLSHVRSSIIVRPQSRNDYPFFQVNTNIKPNTLHHRGDRPFLASQTSSDTLPTTTTTTTTQQQQHIPNIKQISKSHSTFLLDMWGVMHDGSRPYEGVVNTISKLKESRKKMIILSNSSKRQETAIRMLTKLGFDPNDFEDIITSGEVSYRMLAGDDSLQCETWSVLSDLRQRGPEAQKIFVFGSGDGDEDYCTSSGWTLSPITEANLILARGTFTINDGCKVISKTDDEVQYFQCLEESLQLASERNLPMLISNPDKVRPDEGLPPMPGAIGDAYESFLDSKDDASNLIKRIGKPYREVYDLALKGRDPSDACMVGDSLETDVTGGKNVGCTTLWVIQDGIHGPAVEEKGKGSYEDGTQRVLDQYNEEKEYLDDDVITPTFIVPHFRW